MALKQFKDEDGNMLVVQADQVLYVRAVPQPVPPLPPSAIQACIALRSGAGVYVVESVEEVYKILEN